MRLWPWVRRLGAVSAGRILNHPQMIANAKALFDQAEAAVAGDATRLHRVQVATAYCNWNGAQSRVNLEQWSRSQELPQGGSLTLSNTYEILSGATPWGK